VLVHDDTPRIKWKLAVIEGVNKSTDGIIRSADIRTTTGRKNQPIVHLYSLEVTTSDTVRSTPQTSRSEVTSTSNTDVPASSNRPVCDAARRGREQIKQWTNLLRAPPPQRMLWTAIKLTYIVHFDCGI